jgi:8-oxo-dGTP diphosphatase
LRGRADCKVKFCVSRTKRLSRALTRRVRIAANCASFENSRAKVLHRFESCTLRPDVVFYILGGTIEDGESDIDCLIRETKEEVGCEIELISLKFLREFQDVAHGKENTIVKNRIYQGCLKGKPKTNSEIVEVSFFDSSINKKLLSPIARNKIFPWLKKHDLIQ